MAGKKGKRLLVSALILALVLPSASHVLAFDVNENSAQRSQLEQQTSKYQQELSQTQEEIDEKQKESEKLQKQIAELSSKIQKSNQQITALNNQIKDKQKQIDDKLAKVQSRLDLLRSRLRKIYVQGDISSLEIILGAKDFSDFIDKAEMVKSMSDYDDKLIKSLQAEMGTLSEEQKKLKEDKKKVESEKSSLEKNKDKINDLSKQNSELLDTLRNTEQSLKEGIKSNEAMQEELESALAKYNKELAAKAKANRQQSKANQAKKKNEQVVKSSGGYVWPCPGHTYLTSQFEEWRGTYNHGALDIADGSVYGAKVVACTDGTVFSTFEGCTHDYGKSGNCGCGGGYGNYVMVDHGNGKISIYGHLSGVTVTVGQKVKGGQLLGYVGSTGHSTGPHLHFEMRLNGVRYDPLIEY